MTFASRLRDSVRKAISNFFRNNHEKCYFVLFSGSDGSFPGSQNRRDDSKSGHVVRLLVVIDRKNTGSHRHATYQMGCPVSGEPEVENSSRVSEKSDAKRLLS